MGPFEAAIAAEWINPRYNTMHYNTFPAIEQTPWNILIWFVKSNRDVEVVILEQVTLSR